MALFFRGRSDAMVGAALSISLPTTMPSSVVTLPSKSSRSVCVVAALVAFLMGVGVGVTLPFALAIRGTFEDGNLSNIENSLQTPLSQGPPSNYFQVLDLPTSPTAAQTPTSLPKKYWPLSVPSPNHWTSLPSKSLFPEKREEEKVPLVAEIASNVRHPLLNHNIYFGSAIENALPIGFTDDEVEEWRKFVRQQAVVRLREGCGRMQNRLLTFSNGSLSCCRYRQNFDQIQGEIFSFYLSRLLGMRNVPPSTLAVVKTGSWQWSSVGNQLALAQWAEERPVVLTKFVNDLEPAFIPFSLRPASKRRLHPHDMETHDPSDFKGLGELAQWSDLIIFDYLTGNLDRVVNNLYNMQWNPAMMEAPAHNLAQHKESGLLVFLDNESGLLHGFRLLDKYEPYHVSLLEALCVFRRETVERVKQLVLKRDVGKQLQKMFQDADPDIQDFLPNIPNKSIKILNERLKRVEEQINSCENLYLDS